MDSLIISSFPLRLLVSAHFQCFFHDVLLSKHLDRRADPRLGLAAQRSLRHRQHRQGFIYGGQVDLPNVRDSDRVDKGPCPVGGRQLVLPEVEVVPDGPLRVVVDMLAVSLFDVNGPVVKVRHRRAIGVRTDDAEFILSCQCPFTRSNGRSSNTSR